MTAADAITVVDNETGGQFELRDGRSIIGRALYLVHRPGEDQPEQVIFFHTEVDDAYAGQGLASRLAAHALDATVAAGRRIVPVCPYIAAYVRRHPEYTEQVDAPTSAHFDALRAAQKH